MTCFMSLQQYTRRKTTDYNLVVHEAMNKKTSGKLYITISIVLLLTGWLIVKKIGYPLIAFALIQGGYEDILYLSEVLSIDFIALLIGIHGILLLHSKDE